MRTLVFNKRGLVPDGGVCSGPFVCRINEWVDDDISVSVSDDSILITVPSFIKTGMDLGQVSFNPVYTIESYVNNQPVYRIKGFDFNIKK